MPLCGAHLDTLSWGLGDVSLSSKKTDLCQPGAITGHCGGLLPCMSGLCGGPVIDMY